MKRIGLGIAIVVVAALAGRAWYLFGGGAAPAGQAPLLSLNAGNFEELRNAFNRARGTVRVIAMLSPT